MSLLYHGTIKKYLDKISKDGLVPKKEEAIFATNDLDSARNWALMKAAEQYQGGIWDIYNIPTYDLKGTKYEPFVLEISEDALKLKHEIQYEDEDDTTAMNEGEIHYLFIEKIPKEMIKVIADNPGGSMIKIGEIFEQNGKTYFIENPVMTEKELMQQITYRALPGNPEIIKQMFAKERKEHPSFTDEQIWQIVEDHFAAKKNPQVKI